MKLQEKFKQWLETYPRPSLRDVECEVIADEFAIGFAEWIFRNQDMEFDYDENNPKSAFNRLLQIYKKEKGL